MASEYIELSDLRIRRILTHEVRVDSVKALNMFRITSMRAQIASWIAMSCLSVGGMANCAYAGQLMDNILNRKAQQAGAQPATYASSNYASVVSNYGTYAVARPPLTNSALVSTPVTSVPFGVPQTVAGYLPTATYDTQWNPTQVTYYRPVTSFDPRTGTTVTSMQACTGLQYQAQRVPYAAPAAVLGSNGFQANQWPGITGPGYYPAGLTTGAYYQGFQQIPAGGTAPLGTAPLGTSGVSMGMPPSSLPVTTFGNNTALRAPVAAQSAYPTTTYMAPAAALPAPALPTYAIPAYAGNVGMNQVTVTPLPSTSSVPLPTTVMPTTVTPLPSGAYSSAASPVTTLPSTVVPASGYATPLGTTSIPTTSIPTNGVVGSGVVGSGVAGAAYYAPVQSAPIQNSPIQNSPAPVYPPNNYAPAAPTVPSVMPNPGTPCANGVCPLPSNSYAPPAAVNPPGYGSGTTQAYPSQNAAPNIPNLNIPGATVTPLGEPTYTPLPNGASGLPSNTTPGSQYPSINPPANGGNILPNNGLPGQTRDPEAQQPPTLPQSNASNYQSNNDHFVGVGTPTNDAAQAIRNGTDAQFVPALREGLAVNQSADSQLEPRGSGTLMKPPALEQNPAELSSPTLGHVLSQGTTNGSNDSLSNSASSNANSLAKPGSAIQFDGNSSGTSTPNSNVVLENGSVENIKKPVPVPPLLRPSTSPNSASTTLQNKEADKPTAGKVAVPLNSPEGFDLRELWQPNLIDPNDPVVKNLERSLPNAAPERSNTNASNIKFISDSKDNTPFSNASSRNSIERQSSPARWTEPVKDSIDAKPAMTKTGDQPKIHNGVWFEPIKK